MEDTTDKIQCLAWAPPGVSHAEHARRVHADVVPALREARPARLTLHVTESPPPRWALVPFRRRPVALVSVTGDNGAVEAEPWLERLAPLGGARAAYRVTESTPVPRRRSWPRSEPAPGVGLLALLRRHPALPYDDFLQEWHGRHTPMSLEIHPLQHYQRNVVRERLTMEAPPFDGIVTEDFNPAGDLLNPVRLFGGLTRMVPNMIRVGLHIRKFMDMPRLENYLVREYRLVDDSA